MSVALRGCSVIDSNTGGIGKRDDKTTAKLNCEIRE